MLNVLIMIRVCNVFKVFHNLLPLLPPGLLVLSVGIGVTSSIRPIFIPKRARALRAAYAPGPGYLVSTPKVIKIVLVPPLALSLMWRALILSSLSLSTTSLAAYIANHKSIA